MWRKNTEKVKKWMLSRKKGEVQDFMEYKIGGLTQTEGKG